MRRKVWILGITTCLVGMTGSVLAAQDTPSLTVTSDLLGLADTGNKTSLKKDLIYTSGPGDINLYYYLEALCEDYESGVTEASASLLEVMSPINYIVGREGFKATIAPFWRLRVGSKDGDHGVPAAWLLAEGLEKYHPQVEVSAGIAWNARHSLAELTEQDLYDYVAACLGS